MFNYKIVAILSLSAFATVLGGQVAQAEITESSNSAADLIGKSTQNRSQATSTTLAQTDTEVETEEVETEVEVQTETENYEAPATDTPFSSQQTRFTDVDETYWAYPFIQTLAAKNLIAGFPDGSFRPEELVTRAQAAAMLQKAFELPIPEVTKARFSDVPVNYWAAPAIEAAYVQNFLSAYPNDLFLPDRPIIKAEMIDYLASGLQLTPTGSAIDVVNTNYTDARQIPVYAIDEVAAATEANMVVNYPDIKTLNPQSSVTRAETVALLYQALVKLGQVEPISANEPAASYIVGGPGGAMGQTTTPRTPEEQETQTTPDTEAIVADKKVIGPTAPSYIGIGGSLGLVEDTFGDFGAFAINSKLRLFSVIDSEEGGADLSVRPSVIIGSDVTFAVPFTVDLRLAPFRPFSNIGADSFVPYFGPGFLFTTDDDAFQFLLAAGIDIPIGRFTTNAQFNIGFLDNTTLGLTLGVGYNF
jgi:hypothetical protein